MRLINTIEISPYDFSSKEYECPNGSSIEFPDEWNQFWKNCISDKNLGRLESISKGSYLVDIRTINDDELSEILKSELTDVELLDYEEQVAGISGGIVLEENNMIYIAPSCCGDIGDIKEWENIFYSEFNKWNQLWIGHPWVYYKKMNGFIEFSNYTESSPEDLKDIEILVRVSELQLQTELKKVREHQYEFEFRIRKTLEKMGIVNAARISKLMTGDA